MSPHTPTVHAARSGATTGPADRGDSFSMNDGESPMIRSVAPFPHPGSPAQQGRREGRERGQPARPATTDPHTCAHPDLRDEAQTCRAVVDPIGVRLEDLPEPLYRVRCGCCGEATGWWQERRLARAQWVCRWGVAA